MSGIFSWPALMSHSHKKSIISNAPSMVYFFLFFSQKICNSFDESSYAKTIKYQIQEQMNVGNNIKIIEVGRNTFDI